MYSNLLGVIFFFNISTLHFDFTLTIVILLSAIYNYLENMKICVTGISDKTKSQKKKKKHNLPFCEKWQFTTKWSSHF